jgi:pSer/pThr/pTyr-binding forkhead associated (FHA) protein
VRDRLLEQFQECCGAEGPLQLDVDPRDGSLDRRIFHQPFLVVGRNPNADLCVNDPLVSRTHAYLQVIEGRVFCMDLDSRTGTHRDHDNERSGWVVGGEVIRVGPAHIRPEGGAWGWTRTAESGEVAPSPLASRPIEKDPLPVVTLEIPRRSGGRRLFLFDRVLMLAGRSPRCKLRLGDPEVSKFHCSLLRTPTGVWVVDLLGRKGVMVNGARVRFARLEDGDRLEVGRHVIRLRYGAAPWQQLSLPEPQSMVTEVPALAPSPPQSPDLDRIFSSRSFDQAEVFRALLCEFRAIQHQMAEIQQKRADEFQENLILMFQMFGAMHRDQMGLLREEINQLNRLAQEQRALESELDKCGSPSRTLPRPSLPQA